LGSTSVVLDKETSELVEDSTFQGYGAKESDYRPGRWKGFREDYGFTGKEEDSEFGLQYFGKRFLNPYLGRWISADPLAVHLPGRADLNLYAYVKGEVLRNIDPVGLDPRDGTDGTSGDADRGSPERNAKEERDREYAKGYDAETANIELERDIRVRVAPRLYDACLKTGFTPKEALEHVQNYINNTLRDFRRDIPDSDAAREGAAKARADLHITLRDVLDALDKFAEFKNWLERAPAVKAAVFGSRGSQTTSKTMWGGRSRGAPRIDVENPNPGQRAGQIHYQEGVDKAKKTYIYDPVEKVFKNAPKKVNELLERPDVQRAIKNAMKILGESTDGDK